MTIIQRRNKRFVAVGIDPGISGAVAAVHSHDGFLGLWDMPVMANGKGTSKVKTQVNPAALMRILVSEIGGGDDCLVGLERIASMPGQGVASMFSMGDSFGSIRACVSVWGMPMELLTPQQWKRHYNVTGDQQKEVARAKAIQLYPTAELHLKKHHNRAEALLIAHYLLSC